MKLSKSLLLKFISTAVLFAALSLLTDLIFSREIDYIGAIVKALVFSALFWTIMTRLQKKKA